jgi:hypothetical protein
MGGMNAKDFFSLNDYEKLLDIYQKQIVVSITDTPFRKTVKENGNTYSFAISTGHYVPTVFNGAYHITGFYDFNHQCKYQSQSRDVYGGTMRPDMESYDAFFESINKTLKKASDYEEEQEEQIRFF